MIDIATNERGEPDRIYLQIHGDSDPAHCEADHPWDEVSWSRDRVFDSDIEYVRADRAAPASHAGIEQVLAAVRVHLKRTHRYRQSPNDDRIERAYIDSLDRLKRMAGYEDMP